MMTGLRFRLSKKTGMLDEYQEYEIWDESQVMLWVLNKRKGNAK